MKYLPLILLIAFLAACGGQSSSSNPSSVPVAPKPTLALPQPAPTKSENRLVYPNIAWQNYVHPSQVFSISYPDNWQLFEQESGVIFIDPTLKAAYSIQFSPLEEAIPLEAITEFTTQFVQSNFGQEQGFELLPAEEGRIRFKSVDDNFGPAFNEVEVQISDNIAFISLLTVAEDAWNETANQDIKNLLNTLQINPSQLEQAVASAPESEPPVWELFSPASQAYAFLYPSNWTISETENAVIATWPEFEYQFSVQLIPFAGAGQNTDLVAQYTEQQLAELAQTYTDFEMLPISPYQIGETTGYTADFLYTDADEAQIAGSVIIVGVDDQIYQVAITAPAPGYDVALNWFNPIMQSFQIIKQE